MVVHLLSVDASSINVANQKGDTALIEAARAGASQARHHRHAKPPCETAMRGLPGETPPPGASCTCTCACAFEPPRDRHVKPPQVILELIERKAM